MVGERILLVDDCSFARIMVQKYLEARRCDFVHASKVEEALGFLSSQQFDLVITDLMMPGIDGLSFFQKAYSGNYSDENGRIPCPPFILLTSYTGEEVKTTALLLGIAAVVQKSHAITELAQVVDRVISANIPEKLSLTLCDHAAENVRRLSNHIHVRPDDLIDLVMDCLAQSVFTDRPAGMEDLKRLLRECLPPRERHETATPAGVTS